jgi:hypothetical protein
MIIILTIAHRQYAFSNMFWKLDVFIKRRGRLLVSWTQAAQVVLVISYVHRGQLIGYYHQKVLLGTVFEKAFSHNTGISIFIIMLIVNI